MRWVFFSLLILNVVYAVWKIVAEVAPKPSAPPSIYASAPDSLVLLSEAGVSLPQTAVSGTGVALCPALGPWPQTTGAQVAARQLKGLGYRSEVRAVRLKKDRLHWVYLPAYPDRESALKVLRRLQDRKVDSFIVADGEDQNAVSLGYFSSAESAAGLRVKMRTEGYPAEVRETAREVTEYWVYIDPDTVPDGGEALRGLLASTPELTGQQVACRERVRPAAPAPQPVAPADDTVEAPAEPADAADSAESPSPAPDSD